ncbi:MAG: hypothetical protein PQJ49_01690 [Sphaerochaetaceae bacterium]|nr:hypothetical protein [Sphaerochaetaceae bacterium]MDC7238590.1 hypothetical protein [Sphaerochaetaceae bacterium]MDC7248615.1 hypothetical protein [Sphaerochaetaceae bacterium]
MKRVVFLCLIILIHFNLFASDDKSSLDLSLDLAYIDPFIDDILYNELTLNLDIEEDFSLRIPVNFVIPLDGNTDVKGIGGSIDVLYRPLFNGVFVSFSLVKIEYLFGVDAPLENLQYLSKLSFGFTYDIAESLYIEPSVSFFNLNGIYEESLDILKDSFNSFPSLRASLCIGYKIIDF